MTLLSAVASAAVVFDSVSTGSTVVEVETFGGGTGASGWQPVQSAKPAATINAGAMLYIDFMIMDSKNKCKVKIVSNRQPA